MELEWCGQVGGPFYQVELGRKDGRVSTMASVQHALPGPGFNLNQLTSMFAKHGLDQTDLIALSGSNFLSFAFQLPFCPNAFSV